jgi:hypothetical protein
MYLSIMRCPDRRRATLRFPRLESARIPGGYAHGQIQSSAQIQQGIISQFFDPLCFREWDPSTNWVTYRLYRRLSQEHITPIERIPVSGPWLTQDEVRLADGTSRANLACETRGIASGVFGPASFVSRCQGSQDPGIDTS